MPGWHKVETGRSLLVADGIKHAVRNSADRLADLIVVIQRLIRVADAYGYWIASPAESAAFTLNVTKECL